MQATDLVPQGVLTLAHLGESRREDLPSLHEDDLRRLGALVRHTLLTSDTPASATKHNAE